MSTNDDVRAQIESLQAERETLRGREGASDPTLAADATRLEEIRVELDRLWDLLRQQRALRDAGGDPDRAAERPADTVERYQQ
jgi:predicted nuclease with TOPRIM domain